MSHKPSAGQNSEWPFFILALAIVGAICVPLWQWNGASDNAEMPFTAERLSRLFLGIEQTACYACFTWAMLIALSRWNEVRRQRRAFALGLLSCDESARILPEDAWPLQRRIDQLSAAGGPYLPSRLLKLALSRFALSRSAHAAGEIVRGQAEIELARLASSMSTIHYLAWAIPSLGFVGTVRHIGLALGATPAVTDDALPGFLRGTTHNLAIAFDTTLVALLLSLVLMFVLHSVQRAQESLVLDAQQYCVDHLIGRLYESPFDNRACGGEPAVVAPETEVAGFCADKPWV